ncbi:MAG: sporulation protein [Actinobacteria bacterium]|nr:sporulation protein [Actinomycetota bacterium]
MKMMETVERARDAMTVKRVFGDAYEKDGVTLIPAALVLGGAGGGADVEGAGGSGFGLAAFPVGAYVIKDDEVTWRPAVNVTVIVVAGLFTLRTVVKARARKRR